MSSSSVAGSGSSSESAGKSAADPAPPAPTVIRMSPMAHLAVGFFTLGLLSVVLANPRWFGALLIIPVIASALIIRYRTVADADGVTARGLLHSRTLRWEEIDGLRFGRGSWARATRADGTEVMLPAVTFSTLPRLTTASAGRVPNPYR